MKMKMAQQGRGGLGSHKHGVSGIALKSPRERFHMRMDAERNNIKARPSTCIYSSIEELFKKPRNT
jgi:hypothetical protein